MRTPVSPWNTSSERNASNGWFSFLLSIYEASSAIPHAPPSPAVSINDTGALIAAAIIRCPTPFVLNRPP